MTTSTSATPISRDKGQRRVYLVLLAALTALVATGVVLLARHDHGAGSNSAGIRGSGVAATQTRRVAAFDAVQLAGSSNVTVDVGGTRSVVVRADDNLIQMVTTKVRAGELVIANRGSFTAATPSTVTVTVPQLERASLSGSGMLRLDGVRAGRFTAGLPGSGMLVVAGEARLLDATLSGSGTLRLEQLEARDAVVDLSGSGLSLVWATRSLRATVSGSGAIVYHGSPQVVSRDVTGSGSIVGR